MNPYGDPNWVQVSFSELAGWEQDDHEAALTCFGMSAKAMVEGVPQSRDAVLPPKKLQYLFRDYLNTRSQITGRTAAREFFEKNFQPFVHQGKSGFVTAYFEPEVEASRARSSKFNYPLYRRPNDLVRMRADEVHANLPDGFEYGRKTDSGITEYFDRGQIEDGALADQGLELFWLRSEIEGFYIHIQGSARLVLEDASSVRVSFAGKTGHPYTSIGKLLVQRGIIPLENATMQSIRAWLEANPAESRKLLRENRSFIFFQEVEGTNPDFGPVAAAGVQLTPGRSLAVDRKVHPYGLPVWIATHDPMPFSNRPFQRLMIAQDTGSAIVGPERGDLFIGSGVEAGRIAGAVRHRTGFTIFWPREN